MKATLTITPLTSSSASSTTARIPVVTALPLVCLPSWLVCSSSWLMSTSHKLAMPQIASTLSWLTWASQVFVVGRGGLKQAGVGKHLALFMSSSHSSLPLALFPEFNNGCPFLILCVCVCVGEQFGSLGMVVLIKTSFYVNECPIGEIRSSTMLGYCNFLAWYHRTRREDHGTEALLFLAQTCMHYTLNKMSAGS